MHPGFHRLVVFSILCTVFSWAVWTVEPKNIDIDSLYAATLAVQTQGNFSPKAGITEPPCDPGETEHICPDTDGDGKPEKGEKPNTLPKTKCRQVIYLKPWLKCGGPGLTCVKDFNCAPSSTSDIDRQFNENELAQAAAVIASTVKGPKCTPASNNCPGSGSAPPPKPTTPTEPTTPSPPPPATTPPPATAPLPQQPTIPDSPVPPVAQPPAQPPAQGPSAGDQISDIANGPAGNYGGNYSNYGRTPPVPSYSPTGLLNSYSGINGSSYNPAPAGGSVAYAPGTYGPPSVTNTRYDSLDSQNTFAQPLQTPYGSISQLSKNAKLTAEQRAMLVLVDSFDKLNTGAKPKTALDTNILRNSITDATSNIVGNVRDVISGVADFFASILVPSGDRELSEEEKAAEEARRALRFFLESQENLLAAGDPEALPTEIPDDDFQSAQGSSGGFSRPQTFSSGGGATDPNSGATGAIANSNGQTGGGGGAANAEGTPGSSDGASGAAPGAGGESVTYDPSEPQGVVAKVTKAVGSLVSNIGSAIKSGFMRILSWFF